MHCLTSFGAANVQIVGCLANMTVYDLPATSNWSKLLRDHGLLGFFTRMLVPGLAQNDLLLEIIMLIATTATDSQARIGNKCPFPLVAADSS